MPPIRTSYLELVREFPPERAPDRFAEVRAAYDQLRDPVKNLEGRLFDVSAPFTFESIVADAQPDVRRTRLSSSLLLPWRDRKAEPGGTSDDVLRDSVSSCRGRVRKSQQPKARFRRAEIRPGQVSLARQPDWLDELPIAYDAPDEINDEVAGHRSGRRTSPRIAHRCSGPAD